jgi:hypothetical protein
MNGNINMDSTIARSMKKYSPLTNNSSNLLHNYTQQLLTSYYVHIF